MNNRSIRGTMIVIIVLVLLIVGAVFFLSRKTAPIPKAVKIDTTNQPTMGNANAKVRVVAFEDLKCSNCRRYDTELFPKIKKQFIDTNKVKYTAVLLAFIPGSIPAANAALCVKAQSEPLFFDYITYIYHHQPAENRNWATIPNLLDYASKVKGIDKKKLSECLYMSPYNEQLKKNITMAAKIMGNTVATPSVYINGVLVRPLTMKRFKQVYNAVTSK